MTPYEPGSLVIALGGKAILRPGEKGEIRADQFRHSRETMNFVADALQAGYEPLLITHGNGPQVGNILLRSELSRYVLPELPMDTCAVTAYTIVSTEGGISMPSMADPATTPTANRFE